MRIIRAFLVLLLLPGGAAVAAPLEPARPRPPEALTGLRLHHGAVMLEGRSGRSYRLVASGAGYGFEEVDVAAPPAYGGRERQLPDGEVALGARNIRAAWLTRPTDRYDHGVLGDGIEAGGLAAVSADGRLHEFVLGDSSVFEDRLVRLVDLDRDGADEMLVVHSYPQAGAAASLYGLEEGGIRRLAEAAPIGRAYRWLNPVGVADFTGDGTAELAVVITPHIGGILRLYAWEGERLAPVAEKRGFSNHAMGSRELGLSAILDLDGDGVDDILLPGATRLEMRAVTFRGGKFRDIARVEHFAAVRSSLLVADVDGDGRVEVLYLLADGSPVILGIGK